LLDRFSFTDLRRSFDLLSVDESDVAISVSSWGRFDESVSAEIYKNY
jgi:hypothetical protein